MELWAAFTNDLVMKYHVKMNCQNSVSNYTNLDSFIKEITILISISISIDLFLHDRKITLQMDQTKW